jgi:SAM-dependent methyltransferase
MSTPSNLLPDAFAGAALAYARYRPPYPRPLFDDLLARAASPADGALLDLACGPGRLALDLAASFRTVWAVDLEPQMIEVARLAADRRGLDNISWFVGKAEDLIAPQAAFDLITIGEAFHRLDQALIAQRALGWLKPGRWLATLGCQGVLAGQETWQKTVAQVAHHWMARAFPGGWGVARDGVEVGPGSEARALRAAGFVEVTDRSFHEPRDWTFEEIVGYLQSTSVCSKKALGGDFAAFEAELRTALLDPGETQTFHETMTCGYTMGRKPR